MHLIPPPSKFCVTFDFHFSWVLQPSQEKLKTVLMQILFFLGGGGGGWGEQIRYIMGDVQVAYLFIYFQIAVTTSKYNIIEQYTFTKKKKKRRRRKIIYATILASNFIQ